MKTKGLIGLLGLSLVVAPSCIKKAEFNWLCDEEVETCPWEDGYDVKGEEVRGADSEAEIEELDIVDPYDSDVINPYDEVSDVEELDVHDLLEVKYDEMSQPDEVSCEKNVKVYVDNDEDGVGTDYEAPKFICEGEEVPEGYAPILGDCDDDDNSIPGPEILNDSKDNDCDGYVDANLANEEGVACFGQQGSFLEVILGCDGEDVSQLQFCASNNTPEYAAKISPFCMDRTPITIKQYRAFVEQTVLAHPETTPVGYNDPSKENHAIGNLTHAEGRAVCNARNMDLPTAAELEAAAGAIGDCDYPACDDVVNDEGNPICHLVGNIGACSSNTSKPVGIYAATESPQGIGDLMGDLKEMALDKFVEKVGLIATQFDPVVLPEGSNYEMVVMFGSYQDGSHVAGNRRARGSASKNGDALVGVRCVIRPYGSTNEGLK